MPIETRDVPLGGLTFSVDVAGPAGGEPVLLLHGFPETRHMWRAQLEALGAAGYRAIAPDQRGYSTGARPPNTEDYATASLVADACGLVDRLGHPRFHLVGHDWGGQIAWLTAAAHPERVATLSILSRPHPAAFVRAMREDAAQSARSGHHRAFREDDAVARMRAAGLKPLRDAMQNQGVPAVDAEVYCQKLLEPGGIEGAMNWYRASGLQAAETPPIAAPTLYVWGDADATVGRLAAELTREYVTGPYRFEEVAGAGHFVVDQMPARVSELLLSHLCAYAGAASG
jgi:pimeloyl-ACP methyl ester carboxylesterase